MLLHIILKILDLFSFFRYQDVEIILLVVKNLRIHKVMKTLAYICLAISLCIEFSVGEEFPSEVQGLISKRNEAVTRIDRTFVAELEKLKVKYTKAGDLESANKTVKLIENYAKEIVESAPSDAEFDNTFWEFRNKSHLGNLEFLPGGKIRSSEYPDSTWTRIDKDTIRFEYAADKKAVVAGSHVTFKFKDANRSMMTGVQSEIGTPRYLHKIAK